MTEIPIAGGTAVVVAGIIVGLFRFLLQNEIQLLRSQHEAMAERVAQLEVLYDEQRTEKHAVINKYAQAQILLGVIVDLAEKCTCGALDIVEDLLRRAVPSVEPEEP